MAKIIKVNDCLDCPLKLELMSGYIMCNHVGYRLATFKKEDIKRMFKECPLPDARRV